MANNSSQKKKKSTATAKKGTAQTSTSSRSVTVASTAGKGKGGADKSPRMTREDQAKAAQKREEQEARTRAKKKNFSEQYMPYILGALGILTLVFFAVHVMCKAETPGEHWMGPVGYGFSNFFFGLFGWPAFFIPVLLGYLALYWRKNCREDMVALRIILSVVLMVLVSALVHVIICTGNETYARVDIAKYFKDGAAFSCGGVVGGLLGFLLFHGLKLWGTILVSVLVFPLLIMFLVGVTPAYVGSLIKARMAESKAAAKAAAEEREKEEAYVPSKRKSEDKPERKKFKEAVVDDEDEAEYTPPASRRKATYGEDNGEEPKPAGSRKGKTLQVDADTGEVIDDEDDEDSGYVPAPRAARKKTEVQSREDDEDSDYVPASRRAHSPSEDRDVQVYDRKPEAAEVCEEAAEEENEPVESLYIPTRPSVKDRRDRGAIKPSAKINRAETAQEDIFAADDLPDDMETLEISWDDEAEEGDFSAPVMRRTYEKEPDDREKIVVVVNRQETAAVTSTTDYHMDGLSDEEIVLPSEAEEVSEEEKREYAYPPIDLLIPGPKRYEADEDEIVRNTQTLRNVLESFHIRVKEIACSCGPTITRYEVKPDTGVRVRSIANLVDDIALGLAKSGVRIEAPIPGKAAVGIEVPNDHASTVALRNLIETPEFMNHKSRLAACLGADVAGRPVMMDINKMPHLLVAGTTGSGKSVCINSIIMSILYKAKPDEVKLILIDPKKVEFAVYRDLPHLYCPLISDPKKAAGALNSAVVEMERRFELIEEVGVRNLAGYNEVTAGDPERPPLPQMVIIIDELADLMMTASNEVETAICRLAQKARAAGIHLILGTQRPSVDVITGLIKANVPSRIAFTVSAAVDSRTIIDTVGAEKLIGRGDMLYSPVGSTKPMRVQGTFVSDGEVEKVVNYLKEHNAQIEYDESFMHMIEVEAAKCGQGKKKGGDVGNIEDFSALGGDDEDGKFWAAVEVAVDAEKISTSLLQRRLNLGYGRAAKIIDRMEEMGFVGPADGNKPRKLLITKQDLAEIRISGRAEGME